MFAFHRCHTNAEFTCICVRIIYNVRNGYTIFGVFSSNHSSHELLFSLLFGLIGIYIVKAACNRVFTHVVPINNVNVNTEEQAHLIAEEQTAAEQ